MPAPPPRLGIGYCQRTLAGFSRLRLKGKNIEERHAAQHIAAVRSSILRRAHGVWRGGRAEGSRTCREQPPPWSDSTPALPPRRGIGLSPHVKGAISRQMEADGLRRLSPEGAGRGPRAPRPNARGCSPGFSRLQPKGKNIEEQHDTQMRDASLPSYQ